MVSDMAMQRTTANTMIAASAWKCRAAQSPGSSEVSASSAQLATIGYTLSTDHQGKGYATEAVAAIVRWLLTVKKVHRVTATIDPANLASARVLERSGFRYIGTARSAARLPCARPE